VTGLTLGIGVLVLIVHMVSVCLARALRTYSRSRLEELCERRGRPSYADEIARFDERTERSAEALAVLTGLLLAALLGATAAQQLPRVTIEALVAIALVVGGLGHVSAGVLGRVHAEWVLLRLWPISGWLRTATAPLTFVSRAIEALAYRRSRRSPVAPRPASVEVEIHSAGPEEHQGEVEAELPESTRAMLEKVVELTRSNVSDLMTPRAAMVVISASATAQEAARAFIESGLSRIPLFGEHRDDILGVLYAKDLFAKLFDAEDVASVIPRKLARPTLFVPETKNANELLEEFRIQRIQMAIVLDEYGGVAGLITLEDLLEEFVGAIDDEHDAPPKRDPVTPLGNSRYEIDAALPLDEINQRLGLHLPTDDDYTTIGGFAFNALGHLPEPGATFRREGIEFTVLEVIDRSIRRLRLDLNPAAAVGSK
jgi:CBS domain containing-hemolysin-like protein